MSVFVSLTLITSYVSADVYDMPPSGTCNGTDKPIENNTKCDTGTGTTATVAPEDEKTGQKCAVEKIGWFVCPVLEQTAKLSDKAFQVLSDWFLRTDPELVSNQSGTKDAWEIARSIANIMFIIAFLAIIISQVTGYGISNYGLKKMIPRLVVAAIAVNASYYICQLIVDVTNILGYEIQDAFVNISDSIGPSVFGSASQLGVQNVQSGWGNLAAVIVVGALAAAAVVWFIMGPMMAILSLALVTVITVIIILMLRKALIVLLIVIAPIAIVMYLLPNTESVFKKWKDMFIKLLLLFPIVGMLFGAGQLASTIILVSGAHSQTQAEKAKDCNPNDINSRNSYYGINQQQGQPNINNIPGNQQNQNSSNRPDCGMGSVLITGTKNGAARSGSTCVDGKGAACSLAVSWMVGLVALAVAIAPLIAVWSVLKGALAASSAINGAVQNLTKGMNEGARKRYNEDKDARKLERDAGALSGSRLGKALNIATLGGSGRGAKRRYRNKNAQRRYDKAAADYVASESTYKDKEGNDKLSMYGRALAGGTLGAFATQESTDQVLGDAKNIQKQLNIENVKAQHAIIDDIAVDKIGDELETLVAKNDKGDNARTAAMMERYLQLKGPADTRAQKFVDHYTTQKTSTITSQSIGEGLSKYSFFGSNDIANFQQGNSAGLTSVVGNNLTNKYYTASMFADAAPKERAMVEQINAAFAEELKRQIRANPNLKGKLGD